MAKKQKYLMIENTADHVSRISLEKLGLSTKRDNDETIGQFGSGIKFAPIAALRNNWRWIFTGTDSVGEYKLEYKTEVEDGIRCVVYDYGDYQKPSSFTLEAGVLSWTDTFQIYREAIANALDEAKLNDGEWSVSIVEQKDICVEPGKFRVYISAARELMEIHEQFDKYFSVNRRVIDQVGNIKFLEKYDSKMRVYSLGVLVYESEEFDSLFDYEIKNIELNEERRIRSEWDLEYKIASAMYMTKNEDVIGKFIDTFFSQTPDKKLYELEIRSGSFEYASFTYEWNTAIANRYGNNRVILTKELLERGFDVSIAERGYKPLVATNATIETILKRIGVKTVRDIIGEQADFDIIGDIDGYPNVVKAIEIASHFYREIEDLDVKFKIFRSKAAGVLGLTIGLDDDIERREILIDVNHANDRLENVLATVVHEMDHLISGITDNSFNDAKMFRDVADKKLAEIMILNSPIVKIYHDHQSIWFPISEASKMMNVNYSISEPINGNVSIMTIGTMLFAIGALNKFNKQSGCAYLTDDGASFKIDFPYDIYLLKEI